jgi:hypothetical protein
MMQKNLNCLADTWTPLIMQYKAAGDLLVFSDKVEAVAMPAMFLYRQCVELLLKRHLLIGLEVLQLPFAEFAQNYQKNHSLDDLFGCCQGLADRVEGCDRISEEVEFAIAQFQALDPDSVSLRYPLRSDGSPFLVSLTKQRLESMRSHLELIITFFNEQYAVLKEYLFF